MAARLWRSDSDITTGESQKVSQMMQANANVPTVVKARRQSRGLRRRVIGLGIVAALAAAALGSVGGAEARVPADNPRTDGVAWYCGELQDRYDYFNGIYQQRKAANPNDPSLSSLQGEIQQYVYKWEANCRAAFGNIWFFNPALLDVANVGDLTVLDADQGSGRPLQIVTKGSKGLASR
jgi:hypothetical protein